ncbi:MAG: NAD-dependent epimerase/dehydratase family protein [Halodesulfurarchaeum sp.]
MTTSPSRATPQRLTLPEPLTTPETSILITGGAGFIGSHLADALTASPTHPEVRILDDLSSGCLENTPADATFIEGDVRDPATFESAMADVDVVFHESALVSVDASVENPEKSHSINVDGTLQVLEAARAQDARVVLASSAAIYGHPESIPVSESHPKRPSSPYGLDKLTVDHYARLYHELYGLETVALRYFNVYGPRQSAGHYSGVISTFLEQARAEQPITVHGDGSQTRDFVHVSDVVRANVLAAETDHVGEAFNVGTGEETSVEELAVTIQELSETTADVVYTQPRPGDIERSRADVSEAESKLGFRSTVSLEDGLRTLLGE